MPDSNLNEQIMASHEVTAALRTSFVNDVLKKHHELFPNIYEYKGPIKSLKLSFDVTVKNPVSLDFSNVQTLGKGIVVAGFIPEIDAIFSAPNGTVLGTLSLSAKLSVEVGLPAVTSSPITLGLKDVDIEILRADVLDAYSEYAGTCSLDELIKYICEVLLREYLSNLIGSLQLPNPAETIADIPVTLNRLSADNEYLYVGADISLVPDIQNEMQKAALEPALADTTHEMLVKGVKIEQTLTKEEPGAAKIDFREAQNLLGSHWQAARPLPAGPNANDDLILRIGGGALDAVVNRKVNFTRSRPIHGNSDWDVSGSYGFTISNAHASLNPAGCLVRTDFSAWIQGHVHGKDWWNRWFSSDFNGGAKVEPFLSAECRFTESPDGKQVRLRALAFPFFILPWINFSNWIAKLIGWLLDALLAAFANLASTFIIPSLSIFLDIKVIQLPDQFSIGVPVRPTLTGIQQENDLIIISARLSV